MFLNSLKIMKKSPITEYSDHIHTRLRANLDICGKNGEESVHSGKLILFVSMREIFIMLVVLSKKANHNEAFLTRAHYFDPPLQISYSKICNFPIFIKHFAFRKFLN